MTDTKQYIDKILSKKQEEETVRKFAKRNSMNVRVVESWASGKKVPRLDTFLEEADKAGYIICIKEKEEKSPLSGVLDFLKARFLKTN